MNFVQTSKILSSELFCVWTTYSLHNLWFHYAWIFQLDPTKKGLSSGPLSTIIPA